jgi:hypothetical protein
VQCKRTLIRGVILTLWQLYSSGQDSCFIYIYLHTSFASAIVRGLNEHSNPDNVLNGGSTLVLPEYTKPGDDVNY